MLTKTQFFFFFGTEHTMLIADHPNSMGSTITGKQYLETGIRKMYGWFLGCLGAPMLN